MIPVFLILPEEPFEEASRFARACMLQCFSRGEAPFAFAAYAQVLDLDSSHERNMALRACAEWMGKGEKAICYVDRGIDLMMRGSLERVVRREIPLEFRRLTGGHPGAEALHFQDVPHPKESCAICMGPERVAELKAEKLTVEELAQVSALPQKRKED